MSLWEWVLRFYQQPGVEDVCLTLQDRHGQNVSFLLWSVWGSPNRSALERGATIARGWEESVLQPMRSARRALAAPYPSVDDRHRVELREEVIAAELLAERVLLEALETLAAPATGDPLQSVTAAAEAWGRTAPREALQQLVAALS